LRYILKQSIIDSVKIIIIFGGTCYEVVHGELTRSHA